MMLSLDTAYRSFGGEVEASSTPTICRLSDSRRHQLPAIAPSAPVVASLRVSTARQGRSGLGLEAQRENISRFAAAEGYEVVGEFVEVETGKGADALERR